MNDQPITLFAATTFHNEMRRFGIKLDDRRRHMYLIGKTGMGKSVMLENMIISDLQAGNGVAVVDPHGELADHVINFVPPHRIDDVVYFNPADSNFPIGFNILESVSPEYKPLIANGLVGVFKKIWADSWGPRLEYILMNTILALLEYPGSTLLGVIRMLVDKKYRQKVVDKIQDPVVRSFWINEFANYNEKFRSEAISPIQNKVGQFLSSAIIRNIVGQPKSTIDVRKIMDEKKILIINLSKGLIGEENSALLGAMMITKIQLAAMSRADIHEDERKDFYLYVDEFQNFATESFADILSEARKYRLNLIMAHQYIEQLEEEVAAAVFGNVGTLVSFRVGATDAEYLEKEFSPTFLIADLVNLQKYRVYLKLMIDGMSSQPFSAMGLPPRTDITNSKEPVIAQSRERYARPKASVEDHIMEWSGLNVEQQVSHQKKVETSLGQQKNNGSKPRRSEEPRGNPSDVRPQSPSGVQQPAQQLRSASSGINFMEHLAQAQTQTVSENNEVRQRQEPRVSSHENRDRPQEDRAQQQRPQEHVAPHSSQQQGMPGQESGSQKRRRRRRRKKKNQSNFQQTEVVTLPTGQEQSLHDMLPRSEEQRRPEVAPQTLPTPAPPLPQKEQPLQPGTPITFD